jgi:hypothetical protein
MQTIFFYAESLGRLVDVTLIEQVREQIQFAASSFVSFPVSCSLCA